MAARGTSLLELRVRREATPGTARLDLAYTVANVKTAPDTSLRLSLVVDVEVLSARE